MGFRRLVASCLRRLPWGNQLLATLRRRYFTANPGDQWARVVMNTETRKLVEALGPHALDVLEVSGNLWSASGIFQSYMTTSYPDYDICASPLQEEAFDLVIAEQVFEHLLWPYRAIVNVHRMLRPGGHFLITTPFLLRVHNSPTDCSRWTETGIKYFLAEGGFPMDSIKTGSWGNRDCVVANFSRWESYRPDHHSLLNEPDFPVVVWALARK